MLLINYTKYLKADLRPQYDHVVFLFFSGDYLLFSLENFSVTSHLSANS